MNLTTSKHIPASYLILVKNNKILLLRRFNTGYEDGNYSVVAGHVEAEESFTQCIIREAMEEADILLKPNDLKMFHIMHRKSDTLINNKRIDVFFIAQKWVGKIMNKELDKCDDLSWFPLNDMPENIIPYIKQAIDKININDCYSEYGW